FIRKSDGYTAAIDTRIYSLEAIKKAAYRLAERASVIINPGADTEVLVVFNFTSHQAKNCAESVLAEFCNELLDQDLREIIKRETTPVRNLIMAHAFSRT